MAAVRGVREEIKLIRQELGGQIPSARKGQDVPQDDGGEINYVKLRPYNNNRGQRYNNDKGYQGQNKMNPVYHPKN